MSRIERDLERLRELLARKLRESDVTHLQIEAVLDWDRGHVGELLADVRQLQVDELLLILELICVPPKDFWRELYSPRTKAGMVADDNPTADRTTMTLFQLINFQLINQEARTAARVVDDPEKVKLAGFEPAFLLRYIVSEWTHEDLRAG